MWRPTRCVLPSKQASRKGIPGVAFQGAVCKTQNNLIQKGSQRGRNYFHIKTME